MGVNLIPIVRNPSISQRDARACEVQEGCLAAGNHRLLHFDFLCWNAGEQDAVVGNPANWPGWFEPGTCHGHDHMVDFNKYRLMNSAGLVVRGKKEAFCLMDVEKIDNWGGPQRYTCTNQGVTAGWADVYGAGLDCQFIEIDGIADGDYTLEAATNQNRFFREDSYGDNYTWAGLRIRGQTVSQIPVPWYPEDKLPFNPANAAVANLNGSFSVVDGNHVMMNFGASEANASRAVEIIKHYGMNSMCFVGRPVYDGQRMMYFLVNGQAPVGPIAGEDAIPFNPAAVHVAGSPRDWYVTDGNSRMLWFGASQANAERAAWIIKKYQFTHQCFVGRPGAKMTYFRK
jgi:hypothetical protein